MESMLLHGWLVTLPEEGESSDGPDTRQGSTSGVAMATTSLWHIYAGATDMSVWFRLSGFNIGIIIKMRYSNVEDVGGNGLC